MDNRIHLLLLGLLLAFAQPTWGQVDRFVEVIAKRGDGVIRLLDRYQVNNPCNKAFFYQVNQLPKNKGLIQGKTYYLPIYQYTYNKTSIRSTVGNNDLTWAESVQAYNMTMMKRGIKANDYRVDLELWVPYSKIHCIQEALPFEQSQSGTQPIVANPPPANVKSKTRGNYMIFGSKYASVPLISNSLRGKVYYLVAGHGGIDPGAVGKYGKYQLCEDEYAYDISLRLGRNLLMHGATVYLIIRDDDDGIREGKILPCDKDEEAWLDKPIPTGQSDRLTQRSDIINRLYKKNKRQGVTYQRTIVIHVDSDSKKERIDMFFYHKIQDATSKRFATAMHQTIAEKYDQYRKGRGYTGTITSRDLHMLREVIPTSVFIELGNIRNSNDQARLVIEKNRQLVADWLFDGVVRDQSTR